MGRRYDLITRSVHALMMAVLLSLLAIVGSSAHAQDKPVEFVPREEMIDALIHYAVSGGCETLRNVFGPAFDSVCDDPSSGAGTAAYMLMLGKLRADGDRALVEICKRNKVADCENTQEVSRGRAVLTFQSAVRVRVSPSTAIWSPDNRFLVLYSGNQTRLLDVDLQQFADPPIATGPAPNAVAWSPDGKYIALSDHRPAPAGPMAIRLYSSSSFEEKGIIATSKDNKCGFALSREMAFTADSKALWVSCRQRALAGFAIAIKLRLPGLEIEDRLIPVSPGWEASFSNDAISRQFDDLILTGRFHATPTELPKTAQETIAVQSFSLRTKEPLHPPVFVPLRNEAGILRPVHATHLANDLSGVYVWFYGTGPAQPETAELWSTTTRERVAAGERAAIMAGRYLGDPNTVPHRGMHLRVRATAGSLRADVLVLDSRSGATIQEIGPVSSVQKILVSPDGSRVAIFGLHGIRFYRVNP